MISLLTIACHLQPYIYIGAIQLLCVIVLLMGIHSSKITTNALTFLKMVLVLLMIVTAFILFDKDNLDTHTNNGNDDNHSTPHESVASSSGILRGATACYFGYIGFDEVVCLTREAITPSQVSHSRSFSVNLSLCFSISHLLISSSSHGTLLILPWHPD